MPADFLLDCRNLNYYYPNKHALIDISFCIVPQSITALVGPNGAGKTTLMRVLAGLDHPYSGSISLSGIDVIEDPRAAHTKVGYLSDSFGLYDNLTVRQNLQYIAGCHNLADSEIEPAIKWVETTMGLEHVMTQPAKTLSRGWRQRVGVAMAIVNKPSLLILDEPASGLDPESRADLSRVLRQLQSSGMTILVSSHILAELEEYCTSMLVMREGRIKDHVTLKSHQETATAHITAGLSAPLPPDFHSELWADFLPEIAPDRLSLRLTGPTDKAAHAELLARLIGSGLPVCEFAVEHKKLQSIYLDIAKADKKAN